MMWKEKFRIGVARIDEQHKELFRRVADFIQSVQGKGEWEKKLDKVKETLEFMKDYVIVHFNDEEDYQLKVNYPEYAAHKQTHERFKAEIDKYAQKFEDSGYSEETVQEFGGKLMTWLIYHVAGDDQKIGEYVISQEGKP